MGALRYGIKSMDSGLNKTWIYLSALPLNSCVLLNVLNVLHKLSLSVK